MSDKEETKTSSSEPLTAEQKKNAVWLVELEGGAVVVSDEEPKAKSSK